MREWRRGEMMKLRERRGKLLMQRVRAVESIGESQRRVEEVRSYSWEGSGKTSSVAKDKTRTGEKLRRGGNLERRGQPRL
jgi:hypothetical protein